MDKHSVLSDQSTSALPGIVDSSQPRKTKLPNDGSRTGRWLTYFLLFSFASGTLAHLWPAVRHLTLYTTDPLLLVINGLLLVELYRSNRDVRLWYWLAGAYIFTFFVEATGVATGAIFGEYHYGETMRWQWLGVPFVIALNWAMLTLAANELVLRWVKSAFIVSLLAGVVLALYDVVIEPVAISLDYWQWAAPTVPLQNYLAWAVVGAIISLPLHWWKIRFRSPVLLVYFFAQLFFFLALNIGL